MFMRDPPAGLTKRHDKEQGVVKVMVWQKETTRQAADVVAFLRNDVTHVAVQVWRWRQSVPSPSAG